MLLYTRCFIMCKQAVGQSRFPDAACSRNKYIILHFVSSTKFMQFLTHIFFFPAVSKLIRNFHISNQLLALFKTFSVCKFLSEKPNDRFNIQTAQ